MDVRHLCFESFTIHSNKIGRYVRSKEWALARVSSLETHLVVDPHGKICPMVRIVWGTKGTSRGALICTSKTRLRGLPQAKAYRDLTTLILIGV